MARTWMNEGRPLADGRLCLIIDPEDGTNPLRIWGKTKEEVLDKAAKTVEHGQRAITQLRSQATTQAHTRTSSHAHPQAPPTGDATVTPPLAKTTLTDGERLQATADLSNPAKAPAAVTKLVQHFTGIDFEGQKNAEIVNRVVMTAQQWENEHPEFPGHPINRKLMMNTAALRVGYENITAETLDDVYNELSLEGNLVPAEEQPPPPTVQPPETAEPRTVRPRGAASHRRTVVQPTPPAATPPKYTKEQIEALPSAEYRRKLETDPAFAASVAALYGTPANA